MRHKGWTIVVALALVMGISAVWADTRIKFPAGKYGTTLNGGIARGETKKYWVGAGQGQKMKVTISSVEGNAVFRVVGDGGQLSGDYLIEVGSTRGGADYKLSVDIR